MTALDSLERLPGFSFLPLKMPDCRATHPKVKAGLGTEIPTAPSFREASAAFLDQFSMTGSDNLYLWVCN